MVPMDVTAEVAKAAAALPRDTKESSTRGMLQLYEELEHLPDVQTPTDLRARALRIAALSSAVVAAVDAEEELFWKVLRLPH